MNHLSIKHFQKWGFEKVADVAIWRNDLWLFKNIDQSLMYSDHTSWVYLIVVNGIIYKVGETGNPLGIKSKTHAQPVASTKCRMGRLANVTSSHTDTDVRLRRALKESVQQGLVEVWAYKCPIQTQTLWEMEIKQTIHKSLELALLEHLHSLGTWPAGNQALK